MSCVRIERWTEDLTLDFEPGEILQDEVSKEYFRGISIKFERDRLFFEHRGGGIGYLLVWGYAVVVKCSYI